MNIYLVYIVPGIIAFFAVWVLFRILVRKDVPAGAAIMLLVTMLVLLFALGYGMFF